MFPIPTEAGRLGSGLMSRCSASGEGTAGAMFPACMPITISNNRKIISLRGDNI